MVILQEYVESDKARSVRLLLAKHGDQVNQVLQLNSRQQQQLNRSNNNNGADPSSTEEISDEYASNSGKKLTKY